MNTMSSDHHPKTPRILYHYTTAEGLLSMLGSGHLWATDAAFMNDPQELRYGFDLLAEVASRQKNLQRTNLLKDLLRRINDVIQEKTSSGRVYVVSFCQNGDLLSQWRAYGAFGGGYAVGLKTACLSGPRLQESEPARVLRPVIYGRDKQVRMLKGWLKTFVESGHMPGGRVDYADLLTLFSDYLVTFKNPSYREEQEWRLIQFGRYVGSTKRRLTEGEVIWPTCFRVRKGQILPYVDLDLTGSSGRLHGKLPVNEIVCGPTIRRELGIKALSQLCDSLGFDCSLAGEASRVVRTGRPLLLLRLSAAPFVGG